MFDQIVESALNEISAEDAYNKFYKTLPRDAFFELVNMYGKFDNLMKFLLNSISKDKNTFKDAEFFIDKYKKADNDVRIRFNQNFKNGEYEDITDMMYGIDSISKSGVDTTKSIQAYGLVKIYEDDDYLLTCTTTYEANHHFYGDSSWCTASDRFGRYDGWKFFLRYICDDDDMQSHYEEEEITPDWVECVLVQYIDKKNNRKFQIQIDGDGSANQICDYKDRSRYMEDVNMPKFLEDLLLDELGYLFIRTRDGLKKEYPFQKEKDPYVDAKRKKKMEEYDRLQQQLENEVRERTINKMAFVQKTFSNLLNSNLLENKEFVKKIISGPINNYSEENDYEQDELSKFEILLKEQSYALAEDICYLSDGFVGISILPGFGLVDDVDVMTPNGVPQLKKVFFPDYYWDDFDLSQQNAIVIAQISPSTDEFIDNLSEDKNLEIKKIVYVLKNNRNGITSSLSKGSRFIINYSKNSNDFLNNFIRIKCFDHKNDSIYSKLFNIKTLQTVDITDCYRGFAYDDAILFFDGSDASLLDLKTNKIKPFKVNGIVGSAIKTRYSGLWVFGSGEDGMGYIFCNNIVPLGEKLELKNSVACLDNNVDVIYIREAGTEKPKFAYNIETKILKKA